MRRVTRWLTIILAAAFSFLAYVYLTLPDVRPLATTNPETTAFIELRAGEAHAEGRVPRRVQKWVSYERISPHLKRAVLVSEDSAFWQHDGIDLEQLKLSLQKNLEKGQLVRGGSTITQQLAKNLYLSPSKNPVRKFRELIITRRLEAELSKRRILELYLNVVEWGDGIYGAEAAARTYFHRSAASLDAGQAALLAGALINARVLVPSHPNARLLRRQRIILQRMGAVTPPPERAASEPPAPPPPQLPTVEPVPSTTDVPSAEPETPPTDEKPEQSSSNSGGSDR